MNFETGKAELTPESQTILDGVAESLVANEEIKVQVGGHTDNTGSAAVNKRLSAARAEAVRQYLISKGVAADPADRRGLRPEQADRVEQDGRRAGAEPPSGADPGQLTGAYAHGVRGQIRRRVCPLRLRSPHHSYRARHALTRSACSSSSRRYSSRYIRISSKK